MHILGIRQLLVLAHSTGLFVNLMAMLGLVGMVFDCVAGCAVWVDALTGGDDLEGGVENQQKDELSSHDVAVEVDGRVVAEERHAEVHIPHHFL